MKTTPFMKTVDAIYVINLPARADRRREMDANLRCVGLSLKEEPVVLFDAVRPENEGDFPSIGARGCFLSHLGVLRDAQSKGKNRILILEDDAVFTNAFSAIDEADASLVANADLGVFYLGGQFKGPTSSSGVGDGFVVVPPETSVGLTHAMVLTASTIEKIIPYFEAMLGRPAGDPEGGPMHVDGAYSWFRKAYPEIETLAASPFWAVQRSSRSDIFEPENAFKEKIPFIGLMRRIKNVVSRR